MKAAISPICAVDSEKWASLARNAALYDRLNELSVLVMEHNGRAQETRAGFPALGGCSVTEAAIDREQGPADAHTRGIRRSVGAGRRATRPRVAANPRAPPIRRAAVPGPRQSRTPARQCFSLLTAYCGSSRSPHPGQSSATVRSLIGRSTTHTRHSAVGGVDSIEFGRASVIGFMRAHNCSKIISIRSTWCRI